MRCTSPFKKEINGVIREIPCGQCIACRLNHARMWSIRISHEATCHAHNVFLTLTYDDDNLPKDNSVHKRELQLFFKRLRKDLGGVKIRYFACGEYGDQFGRPHYHAIIFGISYDCHVFKNKRFDKKTNGYHCQIDAWNKGLCHIGSVTVDSANYVAGYVTKKLKGKGAKEHYDKLGIEPEFVLMSRRPGIGSDFFGNMPNNSKIMGLFGVKIKDMPCPDFIWSGFLRMFVILGNLKEKFLMKSVLRKPKPKVFLIENIKFGPENSWIEILSHLEKLEERSKKK